MIIELYNALKFITMLGFIQKILTFNLGVAFLKSVSIFYGKVKFGYLGFSMGKSENSGFSETIAACDLKVGRCRQLIEIMKVCEY